MLNSRSKVGIAQITFYIPAVISAAFLLYRHGRPRMAWILLFLFSNIRVVGGIIVILLENKPHSTGLIIASVILLGVGVMPLIVATIGLICIILATDFKNRPLLHRIVLLVRVLFSVGVALLVAGGSYIGDYKSSHSVSLGSKLVKAGYIVVATILAILIAFQAYLWRNRHRLTKPSITIFRATALAIPFLTIRITYAFLSVWDASDTKWNDLDGSIAAFVGMALVMEYIVVFIYVGVGFLVPRFRGEKGEEGAGADVAGLRRTVREWIDRI